MISIQNDLFVCFHGYNQIVPNRTTVVKYGLPSTLELSDLLSFGEGPVAEER